MPPRASAQSDRSEHRHRRRPESRLVITDIVYAEIHDRIAAHPPERGGALYGPRHYPFVTHFEYDEAGRTSAVSYVPSTRLIANVPRIERETGLQFKGIIHSHPRGLTRPSLGDEQTVGSFFRLNPHLSQMALPIVQPVPPSQGRAADDGRRFLNWYRAERAGPDTPSATAARSTARATGGFAEAGLSQSGFAQTGLFQTRTAPIPVPSTVRIVDEDFHVLPLREHMGWLVAELRRLGIPLTVDPALQPLKVHNAELIGLSACEPAGASPRELYFFVSIDYPVVPPVVLRATGGTTTQLTFSWDGFGDLPRSLSAVARAFTHSDRRPLETP